MTCHSWMGPVGVMEGACDTGAGEENTEEERGGARGRAGRGGEGREGEQAGAAEIKKVVITLENVASGSQLLGVSGKRGSDSVILNRIGAGGGRRGSLM